MTSDGSEFKQVTPMIAKDHPKYFDDPADAWMDEAWDDKDYSMEARIKEAKQRYFGEHWQQKAEHCDHANLRPWTFWEANVCLINDFAKL